MSLLISNIYIKRRTTYKITNHVVYLIQKRFVGGPKLTPSSGKTPSTPTTPTTGGQKPPTKNSAHAFKGFKKADFVTPIKDPTKSEPRFYTTIPRTQPMKKIQDLNQGSHVNKSLETMKTHQEQAAILAAKRQQQFSQTQTQPQLPKEKTQHNHPENPPSQTQTQETQPSTKIPTNNNTQQQNELQTHKQQKGQTATDSLPKVQSNQSDQNAKSQDVKPQNVKTQESEKPDVQSPESKTLKAKSHDSQTQVSKTTPHPSSKIVQDHDIQTDDFLNQQAADRKHRAMAAEEERQHQLSRDTPQNLPFLEELKEKRKEVPAHDDQKNSHVLDTESDTFINKQKDQQQAEQKRKELEAQQKDKAPIKQQDKEAQKAQPKSTKDFINHNKKKSTTSIDDHTIPNEVSTLDTLKELKARDLIKEDNGKTACDVETEKGPKVVGEAKHGVKATPMMQAYLKEIKKEQEYPMPENLPHPKTNKIQDGQQTQPTQESSQTPEAKDVQESQLYDLSIIVPPTNSDALVVETGKNKHLLVTYDPEKKLILALGYLTSKHSAETISDQQFVAFQKDLYKKEENKPDTETKNKNETKESHNETKDKTHQKKQGFVPFDKPIKIEPEDMVRVLGDKEYLASLPEKGQRTLEKAIDKVLKSKTYTLFNKDGVSSEEGIKVCQAYDKTLQKKGKHPLTADQIKQNQMSHQTQKEKHKLKKQEKNTETSQDNNEILQDNNNTSQNPYEK